MATQYYTATCRHLFRKLLNPLQKKFRTKEALSAIRLFCDTNFKDSSVNNIPEMKWMPTKYASERKEEHQAPKESLEFAVLSYNVLSQDLLEEHQYLYTKVDPKCLTWKFRASRILRVIQASHANIICLQEVQADHYKEFFTPQLASMGYRGIYKKRTGEKPDGCAIFYDTSMFELVDNRPVEYFYPGVEVLSRDNVGLIAVLSPTSSHHQVTHEEQRQCVVVSTTHLLYNPRRHDIKLAQLQVLFSELDRIAYKGQSNGKNQYYPIILTGDFNFTPQSNVYNFVTRGHVRFKGLGTKLLTPVHHGRALGNELIPANLGITDQCQHSHIANSRANDTSPGISSSTFASGELSHNLKFRPVYYLNPVQHPQYEKVTSYQDGWVVVDHMFFT